MIDWYKKAIFDNYANFSGRARRSEFWYFTLMNMIVVILLIIIAAVLAALHDNLAIVGMILYFLYFALTIIPSLAVIVRRLHDVGKSGWYYFVSLIPFIGSIWLLVLLVTDSEYGTNAWGPNPKNAAEDDINEIGTIEQF